MGRKVLQVANSRRLWGVTDVEGMKGLLADYTGPEGLIHKSHDTNDVYYYPVADDRVKVWKKAIPGIEFTFSVGPCHKCGTNISQKLWTDPDYVHALLASIQEQGADSISCQSSRELLLPLLPDAEIFPQGEHDHARMNSGLEVAAVHPRVVVLALREDLRVGQNGRSSPLDWQEIESAPLSWMLASRA